MPTIPLLRGIQWQNAFTHTDKTFGTPGKVALWTKADSVTRCDWIEIKTRPEGSDKPKP